MTSVQKIIEMTFHKYYVDMLDDLKNVNDNFKKIIDENYSSSECKDSKSSVFLQSFKSVLSPKIFDNMVDIDLFSKDTSDETSTKMMDTVKKIVSSEDVKTIPLVKEMTLDKIVSEIDESYHPTILSYIYILSLLVRIYDIEMDSEKNDNYVKNLFETSMILINKIEKKQDIEDSMNGLKDEKIIKLLRALQMLYQNDTTQTETNKEQETNDTSPPASDDFMQNIQNTLKGTKMGKFADDIINDLTQDMENDMGEITDFESFMKSGKIGKVINKTLEQFQKKNSSGELSQEDILKDCVNLMGMFGSNFPKPGNSAPSGSGSGSSSSGMPGMPGMPNFDMSDMQKVMSLFSGEDKFKLDQSKINQHQSKSQTRDRLRKKLEEKNK